MLILEGPDLAGKTTLANGLVQELRTAGYDTRLVHMNCPKPGETEAGNLTKLVKEDYLSHNLVVDRFLIGDFAYRTIWPREKPITGAQFKRFAWFLRATNSTVFVLNPPDELIKERYAQRGDEMVSLDKILTAAARYRTFLCAVGDLLPIRVLSSPITAQQLTSDATFLPLITRAIQQDSSLSTDLFYMQAAAGHVYQSRRGDDRFEVLDTL